MSLRITFFLSSLLLFICCQVDYTDFIPEPLDPRLPRLSKVGNNIAGAFWNDESWVTDDQRCLVPSNSPCDKGIRYRVDKDTLFIKLGKDPFFDKNSILFKLTGDFSSVENPFQLTNGKSFSLGDEHQAYLNHGRTNESTDGVIHFLNTESNEFTAGTFYIKTETDEITSGRFDYQVFPN